MVEHPRSTAHYCDRVVGTSWANSVGKVTGAELVVQHRLGAAAVAITTAPRKQRAVRARLGLRAIAIKGAGTRTYAGLANAVAKATLKGGEHAH